jgi:hypothetical protein
MPRACTVCTHVQRGVIENALIESTPNRRIATQYGLDEAAVRRHKAAHLPKALAQAAARAQTPRENELIAHAERFAAAEVRRGDDLLARLATMTEETLAILHDARSGERKDNELALKAIARIEKQAELVARLRGELDDRTQVNVVNLGGDALTLAGIREQLAAKLAGSALPQLSAPALDPLRAVIDVNTEPST